MTVAASLSTATAQSERWEVVVIGAGPAGAFAALRLAQRGYRVLLIEKKSFPREKVCGGCVGPVALRLIAEAGIGAQFLALPQQTANRLNLHAGGQSARITIPSLTVVSRANLDACLVGGAIAAGAHFLPNTVASVGDCNGPARSVFCDHPQTAKFALAADFVIAADGLSHSSLKGMTGLHDRVARNAHLGVGTILQEEEAWCSKSGLPLDAVQMIVGSQGYVGLARSEPGQLHVAAAIEPNTLSDRRSPAAVIAGILEQAGQAAWAERARSRWLDGTWCGTPLLTHRLDRVSANRLFVIGDAAAYVEPFTGEGITWALLAAEMLTSMLADRHASAIRDWEVDWQRDYARFLRHRSRVCRMLTSVLRMPRVATWAVRCLNALPCCAMPFTRLLYGRPTIPGHTLI